MRSSLHIILVGSDYYENKKIMEEAFRSYPFPDKYNQHKIKFDSVDARKYHVTEADRNKYGQVKNQKLRLLGQAGGELLNVFSSGSATSSLLQKSDEQRDNDEAYIKVAKFMERNQSDIAKSLLAKWYGYDGFKFNMNLIKERGLYNASQFDANFAKKTVRGEAILADAGENLIGNTFVLLVKFQYYKNFLQLQGVDAINVNGFLYQLNWNDSIQNHFYANHFLNVDEFDDYNDYSMKFIGKQSSGLILDAGYKDSRDEYISWMTVSALDYSISRLQRKFDVFKPITPVLSDNPITAYIGMKEGLKGGEKFEILELVEDPQTNRRSYKRVGTVNVDKNRIWDNRYVLSGKNYKFQEMKDEEEEPGSGPVEQAIDNSKEKVNKTYFEGKISRSAMGLFLRQIK